MGAITLRLEGGALDVVTISALFAFMTVAHSGRAVRMDAHHFVHAIASSVQTVQIVSPETVVMLVLEIVPVVPHDGE